ncbi:hypothetical protein N7509_007819 [Penicillium cosmopolitanum]|uniref:Uncharacterized protein n=1 Tax=Penicillium cosmopolitanum TaxID=1131564 RepID=A0A9X0B8R1_9EURO|nr:uncharacterized protein N7509_007819 [Penicillium cosmopolitanum]KAJ5392329.1 hypothetical protein N7509_007819 [Penicillium cosmopolitanum]
MIATSSDTPPTGPEGIELQMPIRRLDDRRVLFSTHFSIPRVSFFATPVEKGALSRIFAAVSPEAKHGQYYGPIGKVESGSGLAQGRDLQEKLFGGQGELAGHDVENIL